MGVNKNLMVLDYNLKEAEERLELIRKIINQPNLDKLELTLNLKVAQSNLTDIIFSYLYMETKEESNG